MTIGLILLILVGLGILIVNNWADLSYDPVLDGEKRPAPAVVEEPEIQSRQPEKPPEYPIHYTPITRQAFQVENDFEWKNMKTADKETATPKASLELTEEEVTAMNNYNANAGKKARIKLNETDFQKLKACFLLGLSAVAAQGVHKAINLRLVKGYLAVYNTVHNPKKARAKGATNPSPRTVSHPLRTAKRAKKKGAKH